MNHKPASEAGPSTNNSFKKISYKRSPAGRKGCHPPAALPLKPLPFGNINLGSCSSARLVGLVARPTPPRVARQMTLAARRRLRRTVAVVPFATPPVASHRSTHANSPSPPPAIPTLPKAVPMAPSPTGSAHLENQVHLGDHSPQRGSYGHAP